MQDLQLEVFVNGVSTGLIGAFRLGVDGVLTASPEELAQFGIRARHDVAGDDGTIRLDRVEGVEFAYDAATQSLWLRAPDTARLPRSIDAGRALRSAVTSRSGWGLVSNYTLFANVNGRDVFASPDYRGVSATFDNVAFSPYGNLNGSFIVGYTPSRHGGPDFLRLETGWTLLDEANLAAYAVGDLISGGLLWTRPIRLGGLQARRNFGLRPDLVTFPIPRLGGSAAVPSTVEVFINGRRTLDRQIPDGPFQVTNLPVVAGPGQARLVVTDASGQRRVTDVPFYISTRLLARERFDYSIEAGYPRNDFGVYSDVYYPRPVAAGTARFGLTDDVTLEAHAEGGAGVVNGGFGAVFALASYGVASLAGAASSFEGRVGQQLAGSIEIAIRDWRIGLRSQRSFGDYRDVAAVTADDQVDPQTLAHVPLFTVLPPRAVDQLTLSTPLFSGDSLNFNFTNYEQEGGTNYRVASIGYSRPLFGGNLYLSGFVDTANRDSYGAMVGFSLPLGSRSSGSVSASNNGANRAITAQASRSEGLEPGSYGWRVLESEGTHAYRGAAVSYRGQHGRVEFGVHNHQGATAFNATLQGAIVAAGGGVFLSNQITDSFGVVDVGVPGVAVRAQNRWAGTTGADGRLLVPGLLSYQENIIEIDPTNLPVDAQVAHTRRTIVPAAGSGVPVSFGVRTDGAAAIVGFVNAAGASLPLGAIVARDDATGPAVVGYDGQAFLQNLTAQNQVVISLPDGTNCRAAFAYTPRPGRQVLIEQVPCH